tara:strand:- start:537 stop:1517 length:981 start_codon:yes stop_codon:yes gene_type:complete
MSKRIQIGNLFFDIPQIPQSSGFILTIFFIGLILFTSIYTIDANEQGVVLTLGRYSRTTDPGIHLKIPFGIEKIYKVRVDYQYKQEFGFRTKSAAQRTQYSSKNFEYESWMLTGDLNIAEVEWIVQYKIKNPKKYLFNIRDVQNTIRDVSEATMRLMVGDKSFQDVLKSGREVISDNAKLHMQKILDQYESGISIQLVQLQDVLPPEPVADSFNEVNRAKQEQESAINEARQAYNKEIYKVEGEAQKMISEAEGYAIERVNTAKGDVQLFTSVLKEYKKAPQITKDRLYIENMESILKKIPHKIIIDEKLENILPLLDLNRKGMKK